MDEKEKELKVREGLTSKLFKAGVLFLASGKALGGNKNKAFLQAAITTGGTFALSRDDDRGGDGIAASIFAGGVLGYDALRKKNFSNIEGLIKAKKFLQDVDGKFNSGIMNAIDMTDKLSEDFAKGLATRGTVQKAQQHYANKKYGSILTTVFADTTSTAFDIGKNTINTFLKNGFEEGMKNLGNSQSRLEYERLYKDKDLNLLYSKKDFGDLKYDRESFLGDLKEKFPIFKIFNDDPDTLSAKKMARMRRYQNVENLSFFADLSGMYSKVVDGELVADMGRIAKDGVNNVGTLNILANQFKKEVAGLEDSVISENKFLSWLKQKGMGELVDNHHTTSGKNAQNGKITIGEFDDFLRSGSKEAEGFLSSNKAGKTPYLKYYDDNFYGVKNIELLKNFSLTDVVEKGNGGVVDKTAFNGDIAVLKTLGILEKSSEAFYKNVLLSNNLRRWNPFGFIESDARIKNVVENKMMSLTSQGDSVLMNKFKYDIDKDAKTITKSELGVYYKENRSSILEMYKESYKLPHDMSEKKAFVFSNVKEALKAKGLKGGIEEVVNSDINFLPFYHDGSGVKLIKKGGYYSEDPFYQGMIDRGDIGNSAILNIFDKKISSDSRLRWLLGSNKDFNLSEIKTDNERVEQLITSGKKSILDFLLNKRDVDGKIISDSDEVMTTLSLDAFRKKSDIFRKAVEKFASDNGIDYDFTKLKAVTTNKNAIIDDSFIDDIDEGFLEFGQFLKGANKKTYEMYEKAFGKRLDADIKGLLNSKTLYARNNIQLLSSPKLLADVVENIGEGDTEKGKRVLGIIKKVSNHEEDKNKAVNAVNRKIKSGIKTSSGEVKEYLKENNLSRKNNFYNDLYEVSLGFENDKRTQNEFDFYDRLYNDISEISQSSDVKEGLRLSKKNVIPKTNIKALDDIAKEVKKDDFTYSSYKSYGKMFGGGKENFRDIDFFTAVNIKSDIEFKKIGENLSSIIMEDTMARVAKDKSILAAVREFMVSIRASDGRNSLQASMKVPIKKVQDAFNFIGIQNLSNESLGNTAWDYHKNFFLKRYLPMAGAILGLTAANAASDILVPDEVPIIGNGLFGAGVKTVAGARVALQYGAKYTGMLALGRVVNDMVPGLVDNGLTNWFDPLMDPEEMIDVYFRGKEVRVNKNRGWFTSGRQDARGDELLQYRQHSLYRFGNRDSGIYNNKAERFFRDDFLPTSLAWTALDPYLEERRVQERFGAVYPKSQQLFKDIPVFGYFLSATIGEMIKPTKYFSNGEWVDEAPTSVKNPYWDERDPESEYMKVGKENKFFQGVWDAVDDYQQFAGMQGYLMGVATEKIFGKTNPYEGEVSLSSLDRHYGWYRAYDEMQLGDMFGITEPIRRILSDSNSLGMVEVNPLRQEMPDWIPEYSKNGGNAIMENYMGYRDVKDINKMSDIEKYYLLSKISPNSKEFKALGASLYNNMDNLNKVEKEKYYEASSIGSDTGKDYINNFDRASDKIDMTVTIDKVLSNNEFISEGKRFKLEGVEDNFRKLASEIGGGDAFRLMERNRNTLKVGSKISFTSSSDEQYGVGTDEDGNYIRAYSKELAKGMEKESSYDRNFKLVNSYIMNAPMSSHVQKTFGVKSAYANWSNETVFSNEFRDWDTPVDSFVEPFMNLSSNNILSNMSFAAYGERNTKGVPATALMHSLSKINLAGNMILGRNNISSGYKIETAVMDEVNAIRAKVGHLSSETLTSENHVKNIINTLNDNDKKYFIDLVNNSTSSERDGILSNGNTRMGKAMSVMIEQRQRYLETGKTQSYQREQLNENKMRLSIQKTKFSKLDKAKFYRIDAYKGQSTEGEFISKKLSKAYGRRGQITSTISPSGRIIINKGGRSEGYN